MSHTSHSTSIKQRTKRDVERVNDDVNESPSKRRRIKAKKFDGSLVSSKEEKMIAAALRNSLQYMTKPTHKPVNAPVFFPSIEEFADPLAYIAS